MTDAQEKAGAKIVILQDDTTEGNSFGVGGIYDAPAVETGGKRKREAQLVVAQIGDAVIGAKPNLINDVLVKIAAG